MAAVAAGAVAATAAAVVEVAAVAATAVVIASAESLGARQRVEPFCDFVKKGLKQFFC